MLIHKRTMGVLTWMWTGGHRRMADGTTGLVMREYRFSDLPREDWENWWELPTNSPLGRKIRQYYPWLEPVLGPDGELLDVTITADDREVELERQREQQRAAQQEEAARRGYRKRGMVRPTGLMPFLNAERSSIDEPVRKQDSN